MQGKDAMQDLVAEINKGEPCILLGTQMLTKGHHFPGVNLVAVIDTDAMLFSADFRGEERMAQLLTQVAGRAGRADLPGSVILQTHYPDHPALQAMLNTSYAQQAREQLARRQATGMPPVGQLVVLRTDCGDAECGERFLQDLRDQTAADSARRSRHDRATAFANAAPGIHVHAYIHTHTPTHTHRSTYYTHTYIHSYYTYMYTYIHRPSYYKYTHR